MRYVTVNNQTHEVPDEGKVRGELIWDICQAILNFIAGSHLKVDGDETYSTGAYISNTLNASNTTEYLVGGYGESIPTGTASVTYARGIEGGVYVGGTGAVTDQAAGVLGYVETSVGQTGTVPHAAAVCATTNASFGGDITENVGVLIHHQDAGTTNYAIKYEKIDHTETGAAFCVTGDAKVGIGTYTPSVELDVNGNAFVGGSLEAQDDLTASRVVLGNSILSNGHAAPVAGAHLVGEIVFNDTPTAGGTIGWVCVTAGTPGTWKTFGVIAS